MNNKTPAERYNWPSRYHAYVRIFCVSTCDCRHVVNWEGLVEMGENGDVEP